MTAMSVLSVRLVVAQLCSRVPGGTGRYTGELARALAGTVPAGARLDGIAAQWCEALARLPVPVRRLRLPDPLLARLWERGLPPRAARTGIVHAPTLLIPPASRRHRLVVTVHDVVPWSHPQTLTPRGVAFHQRMGERAARTADLLVTPTRAVADQVRALLQPRCPVEVYPPGRSSLSAGQDADRDRLALGVHGDYVLFVGTAEPRKGLDVLVRALAQTECAGLRLVVAGPPGWGNVRIRELASRAGIEDRVTVTGFVDDNQLAALYSGASVLAMPSRAEGFGLPVLEAMAFGVPVVTSDDPALVEVGGGATLVMPVGDWNALAKAIAAAAYQQTLRQHLSERGLQRARAYTWHETAQALWRRYADLLSG